MTAKIIGAIVIISACSISSYRAVLNLTDRVRSLQSIEISLGVMKGEISGFMMPVPELFENLGKSAPYPANILFRNACREMESLGSCSFFEIWRNSVEKTPELKLRDTEKLVLCQVGLSLGKFEAEAQTEAIDRAISRMAAFRSEAQEERRRDGRLHGALGVMAGIFAVIVLL